MSAPDREMGTGFAAIVNATIPGPWPLVVVSATQLASADTDQVQSRVVDTEMDPVPPLGGNGAAGAPPTVT